MRAHLFCVIAEHRLQYTLGMDNEAIVATFIYVRLSLANARVAR